MIINKIKLVIGGKIVIDASGEDAEKALREEEVKQLEREYEITHPEQFRNVSGCCDSAENYSGN